MIDICFLGTGGTLPMADRGLSSAYIRTDGAGLIVDCGEGTQVGIRKCGWGFKNIEGMVITHFHGDHVTGIPGFLMSMDKTGRTEPFAIYGPKGLRRIIDGLCVVVPHLDFPLEIHEISPFDTFSISGLEATAIPLNHGVPCLGYHFSLKRQPEFDPEKARNENIPVRFWNALQHGQTVTDEGGTVFTPDMVVGKSRKGLSFLYATDTRPVAALSDFGAYTDLMILEGMYGNDEKREQALKNHHMIFHEAAEIAAAAGTDRLILTHFSTSITDPLEYLPEIAGIFPKTTCAADGMEITLNFEKE